MLSKGSEKDMLKKNQISALQVSYPSKMDSLQQYRLSNFCLVTESLTFIAGTQSFPALESWYSLTE